VLAFGVTALLSADIVVRQIGVQYVGVGSHPGDIGPEFVLASCKHATSQAHKQERER
jgi:hypothetical protein